MSLENIKTCNVYACEASFLPDAEKKRVWEKYFK
jgi:hypothetical protein